MPRTLNNALSTAQVRHAKQGEHGDGNGLALRVSCNDARSWVQRLRVHGKPVTMGLGSALLVTLAEARAEALENRRVARKGGDPRTTRTVPTFDEAQRAVLAQKRGEWRSVKQNAHDWQTSMAKHVLPRIGRMPVDQIGTAAVDRVLRPIAEQGQRGLLRNLSSRIATVLSWAAVHEHRSSDDPVKLVCMHLPKQRVHGKPAPALKSSEVRAALSKLDASGCTPGTKLAIRFLVLTAARQVEVRRATWGQISGDVWTIPAELMKAGREHRVPLSSQALDVLREARKLTSGELIFPGRDGMLGVNTISTALSRADIAATGHMFRSSFKGWARDEGVRDEWVDELLSEFALAHVVGSATVRAYARSDLLEQRRPVMQQWADAIID